MDVCALSRPFDDQRYPRIRLETEAVNLILLKIREQKLKLLFSPVHLIEIEGISDFFERIEPEFDSHRHFFNLKIELSHCFYEKHIRKNPKLCRHAFYNFFLDKYLNTCY